MGLGWGLWLIPKARGIGHSRVSSRSGLEMASSQTFQEALGSEGDGTHDTISVCQEAGKG